jgi:hypothetical protein
MSANSKNSRCSEGLNVCEKSGLKGYYKQKKTNISPIKKKTLKEKKKLLLVHAGPKEDKARMRREGGESTWTLSTRQTLRERAEPGWLGDVKDFSIP